ncbi:MAG: flagellar export protein FliJ [Treponema sp.]|nr:flagellar export protein FliJ [Treponema sp.]
MKKFKFNLEKILQIRKFKEEETKLALGQAISALNKIENEIKVTALMKNNAVRERYRDPQATQSWEVYILRLEQEAQRMLEQAAQAQLVVEEKRAIYLDALKDYKAMEKLKENEQKAYRKEMLDTQMDEVDELTATGQIILH